MSRNPRTVAGCWLAAAALTAWAAAAQPAAMVKDVRAGATTPLMPSPALWTAQLNGFTYFEFDDGLHGAEIWRSDGTALGTGLFLDICPGICGGARISELVLSGGRIFFSADDGAHGEELWASDGTVVGTHLAADIAPGLASSSPSWLTDVAGVLFFAATDAAGTRGLWRSDGSVAGTYAVAGTPVDPNQLVALSSTVFFVASDGIHGYEPWISDGSVAGTQMLSDTAPGSQSGAYASNSPYPHSFYLPVAASGRVYFSATEPTTGTELWRTDGTAVGTGPVADLLTGPDGASPQELTSCDGGLYFVAAQPIAGQPGNYRQGLFVVISPVGVPAELALVDASGPARSPFALTCVGDRVFFSAATSSEGNEPWVTDGTTLGTHLVTEILPGAGSSFYTPFWHFWGQAGGRYFAWANDGLTILPWGTDGTALGTERLVDPTPGSGLSSGFYSSPFPLGATSGFTAMRFVSTVDYSLELWATDGTRAGTHLVVDLPSPSSSSFDAYGFHGAYLAGGGSLLAFTPALDSTPQSIWTSDGTGAGTGAISVPSTSNSLYYGDLLTWRDSVFFANDDGVHGREPWVLSSGVASMLVDTDPGTGDTLGPLNYASAGSVVFFSGSNAVWRTDGTSGGTTPIDAGSVLGFAPSGLGVAYLRLEGTGCTIVHADVAGVSSLVMTDVGPCGAPFGDRSRLYFFAHDSHLWTSDGTALGSHAVVDLETAGPVPASPVLPPTRAAGTVAAGRAYFVVTDPTTGPELWTSDGTATGTHIVKDIFPGAVGSSPQWLTAAGTGIFFVADDGTHGRELWWSDGSDAGTFMVKDIVPGPDSGLPQELAFVDSVLMFSAHDAVAGRELWASNGSDLGTVRLQDIAPGTDPSSPMSFTLAGTNVFFYANDGVHGFELWALPRAALADLVSASLAYYTVTPCRVLDTRGGAPLSSGVASVLDIAGHCGIPATAKAVAVNLTAVGATAGGSLTGGPGNQTVPATTVIAFGANKTRAASAVVRLATDGSGTLKAEADLASGATVNLVLDVAGWFE